MLLSSEPDKPGWRERWLAWRNRVLADPAFQHFAARFPVIRGVARRRARALFDLVAGFTYSQTLAACIETGLLELLRTGPLSVDDIAAHTTLPVAGAERLLRAAAALDLTQPLDNRWTLGSAGAALLGNRGIAEMVAHHRLLYADLADPVALLRAGRGSLADYWDYDGTDVAAYSRLMAASQPLVAQQVIDAYPFVRHRRMLDVGGGEGAFLAAVAARVPALSLALFDLPAVGARARDRFGETVAIHAGSFLDDPLPTGHDLITLIRVLHDHDDSPALKLLCGVHAALPAGGTVLIAEPMAGTRGAEPAGDTYFGMYLLAMGQGRPRRLDEIAALLKTAGFGAGREVATAMPLTVQMIVAQR